VSRPAHVPQQLQFAPFRGSAAVAAGLLTKAMLRGATWRRLLPDVYVHRTVQLDHRAWCDAVALTLPTGAALGGLTAARLWGVNLLPREAPVAIVVPRTKRVRHHPRISVHYTVLGASDLSTFGGLPVTNPLRTAFDLGRRSARANALVAVDALLHRRVVKLERLQALASERVAWPGMSQLNELLLLAEPLAESPMETWLRLLLHDAGLPPAVAQYEVRTSTGRFLGRVDLAWPSLRLAIEYEGDHHRERGQFRRDVARLNALRAAGWTVLRFTAEDVMRRPGRTVRQVAAAMRELRAQTARAR
jgi:uncharacterized protein DUF559/transcriptional regulator with AbiEi antitoxin domain of type IV toxin-antitoxin system